MRTWLAPVALLLAVACGGPDDLAASARDEIEAAADAAAEAKKEASAASDRAEQLEMRLDDLSSQLDRASRARAKMVERLGALRERLWGSINSVRAGLGESRSASAAAAADAAEALSRAGKVARDLAVLEGRYDYHLRRYHGGG
jgi:chromosome segregation ATPase